MKQRGRVRRIAKWGGTVACVLLVGMLVLSGWYEVQWRGSHGLVVLLDGSVRCGLSRNRLPSSAPGIITPAARHWYAFRAEGLWRLRLSALHWLPRVDVDPHTAGVPIWIAITVPIWIPLLVIALPTVYLWWRDRRYPPGHCQKCGYNLTGNVSGRCPECGTPVPPSAESKPKASS